jgi:ParB-like chromosome segregation protein Spo0J
LLPGDTPRLDGEDARHVRLLAESDATLPPILVHRRTRRVIDGMHRLRAAQSRGQETIEVRFFDGGDDEVFIAAVQANRAHGLPLTLADREAAAARVIGLQPHRSDRSIAEITGLSARTVAEIRRRTGNDGPAALARVGRDGRTRPLNSADGRRVASEVIVRQPEASLREVARMAGVSPATARDVRERLRRGDDPLPPKVRGRQRMAPVRLPQPEPDRGTARVAAVPDRESMLRNLSRDPSLRFTESGRALLRWLFARANGPDGWEDVIDAIPPHCAYIIEEVARERAEAWSAFAAELQQRLHLSGPEARAPGDERHDRPARAAG